MEKEHYSMQAPPPWKLGAMETTSHETSIDEDGDTVYVYVLKVGTFLNLLIFQSLTT